jgi:ribonuclease BN (tRNA processing enzyme)
VSHVVGRAIKYDLPKDYYAHNALTDLLSHISPAIDANPDAVLASIRQSYAGPVTIAKDGLRLQP